MPKKKTAVSYYSRRKNDPVYRYKKYVRDSVRRNLNPLDQAIWSQLSGKPCHYCGLQRGLNGIDRVRTAEDYGPENSVSCCGRCNFMKWRLTEKQFVRQCKRVCKHNSSLCCII